MYFGIYICTAVCECNHLIRNMCVGQNQSNFMSVFNVFSLVCGFVYIL